MRRRSDQLGSALQVYAFVAMTVAAIGIARAVEPTFPRASAALLAFAVLGCAGGVGFGIDTIVVALWPLGLTWLGHGRGARTESASGPARA